MPHKIRLILISLLFFTAFSFAAPAADPSAQTSIYSKITGWYIDNLNYGSVMLLMTVESSFIPFPSEVVVPPAAYKALQPDSGLNIALVILAATFGALIGALINYYLAKILGKPIIYKFADSRFGHMCLLDSGKVERAEAFFRKHGAVSTFVGRLISVVRQLISIPAGLSGMRLFPFCLFTALGALIWNIVLAVIGVVAHGQSDIIEKYNTELSVGVVALAGIFIAYILYKGLRRNKSKGASPSN